MKRLIILILITASFAFGCSEKQDPDPQGEGKILILMYHRLVEGEAGNTYERSRNDFIADLEYLKSHDIKVIDFDKLEKILASGTMPHNNCAIITFDDGDHSWYTIARPLLLEYGYCATFFLWTNMMGRDSFLGWNEIENMSFLTLPGGFRPFRFESHSFSHPYLLDRRAGFESDTEYNLFLDYELRESKAAIDAHTPEPVSVLALPYGNGAGDEIIMEAAARNGYRCIRTSVYGAIGDTDTNPLILPSFPVLDITGSDEIGYYLGL